MINIALHSKMTILTPPPNIVRKLADMSPVTILKKHLKKI